MATSSSLASVLGVLFVFTLFHNPITVAGQNIPQVALFTFGDSNFDAGNKKFLTSVSLPQNFWPYGKSRDDPNGKFSDGKIVPDFIAKFMGISHDIPPALDPNSDITRGASFAVDSATILGTPKDSLSLNQQVRKFINKTSSWSDDDYIAKSVFMIFIGMEDYLDFTKKNPTADGSHQKAFVDTVTKQLKYNIELLYASRATKFIIYLLPPLGCLPIVRQDYRTANDCYEKLNDLAKLHNAKIGPMMNDLATNKSGFQFTVFDFYNSVLRRTHRHSNYRFAETNISCCGLGTHNAFGCGSPNVHSKLCEYQRSYLYFDGRHNTEKAQESFAHLLFGADPNVIQPMTTRELLTHPVYANMTELWKEPVESVVNARAFMENVVNARAFM